ncbi:unnamed protein product [Toxocara canis]|uniref:Phospholipase A2 n=1 Tax=Toxocara canis TaxID=6265 RepID=A0A183TYU7_TOXCA|nr:unnamed protein product [Toxocara canis]
MQARWLFAYAVIAVSARSVDKATGDEKHTSALELVPQFEPSNFSVSFVPLSKAMWNMEGMSECMLHYSAIIYNGYGCYCGFGGSGTPVDDIDECCMHHDNCYEDAISKHGCTSSPMLYFTSYHWDCIDSKISCRRTFIFPYPGQSDCKEALCECDKEFTICQSKFPRPNAKARCK